MDWLSLILIIIYAGFARLIDGYFVRQQMQQTMKYAIKIINKIYNEWNGQPTVRLVSF